MRNWTAEGPQVFATWRRETTVLSDSYHTLNSSGKLIPAKPKSIFSTLFLPRKDVLHNYIAEK